MFEYLYAREIVNGSWDINNPALTPLARVIAAALPTKGIATLDCNEAAVSITFRVELDAAEKLQLDRLVADYKNGIVN